MGCDEVIAIRLQPLQKLIGHFGAHRMRPAVTLIRIAAAVSEPAGERFFRAQFERLAKDILLNRGIGFEKRFGYEILQSVWIPSQHPDTPGG